MGVYIKGLDMPKEPWDCPCHNGETGQCKVINIGCYDYIPKCCPLVEVPTPHGRLGDLDALNNGLREQQKSYEHTFGIRRPINEAVRDGITMSICHIDNAPTIIEADKESE